MRQATPHVWTSGPRSKKRKSWTCIAACCGRRTRQDLQRERRSAAYVIDRSGNADAGNGSKGGNVGQRRDEVSSGMREDGSGTAGQQRTFGAEVGLRKLQAWLVWMRHPAHVMAQSMHIR